nr:DUF4215 domain-containing protein [Kofleriaceae bacterium]
MRGLRAIVGVGVLSFVASTSGCKNPATLTEGEFGSAADAGIAPPPAPRCGDGIVNQGEVCDDGNTVSGDGCSADCKSDETCGNRIVDTDVGETCDDGNTVSGDGCSANCQSNETCGNGIVDPGEQCDSKNQFTQTCNPNCTFARCGDGLVNHAAGESCDDGNSSNTDACLDTCQLARCGDGFVEAGVEQCDDGNTKDGDGCDHTCHIEAMLNPSFEMNYSSWTLQEAAGLGAWGIGSNGQTITGSDSILDLETMTQVPAECLSVTGNLVIDATAGVQVAFNVQVGPDDHRMFQTVNIPATAKTLLFDVAYRNSFPMFDGSGQFLAINLRDPTSDSVLATPFKTGSASPLQVPMSTQSVDVSAYAGQKVRLDVELQVQDDCFDVAIDNFRFQ